MGSSFGWQLMHGPKAGAGNDKLGKELIPVDWDRGTVLNVTKKCWASRHRIPDLIVSAHGTLEYVSISTELALQES
jgi:hypothetical protein